MAGAVTDLNKQSIEVRLEIDMALLSSEKKNFYDLLGVGKQCERSEIESAGAEWRRKIQRWSLIRGLPEEYHPRLKGLKQKVDEACSTLTNTIQRIHYDQRLRGEESSGQTSRVLPRTERAQEVATEPPVWGSGSLTDTNTPQRQPGSPPSQPSMRSAGSNPANPVVRSATSSPNHLAVQPMTPPAASATGPRPSSSPDNPQADSQNPLLPPRRTTAPWETVGSPGASSSSSARASIPPEGPGSNRSRTPPPVDAGVVFPPPLRRPTESAPMQWQRPEVQPPASAPGSQTSVPTPAPSNPPPAISLSPEARIAALEAQLQATRAQIVALYNGISQAALALELLLGSSESPEQRRERLSQATQIAQRLAATFPPR